MISAVLLVRRSTTLALTMRVWVVLRRVTVATTALAIANNLSNNNASPIVPRVGGEVGYLVWAVNPRKLGSIPSLPTKLSHKRSRRDEATLLCATVEREAIT